MEEDVWLLEQLPGQPPDKQGLADVPKGLTLGRPGAFVNADLPGGKDFSTPKYVLSSGLCATDESSAAVFSQPKATGALYAIGSVLHPQYLCTLLLHVPEHNPAVASCVGEPALKGTRVPL